MAKSRRVSRKGSRKSRKGSRKAHRKSHRKTHRMRGGMGVLSKLYSPVNEVLGATENVVGAVTNTARNVVKTGVKGIRRVGKSVTGRADAAIRGVFSRKRRANRR